MKTAIEQRIKKELEHSSRSHIAHRYCVMKKELEKAIEILEKDHRGIASVLSDITPVLDDIIESVKYYRDKSKDELQEVLIEELGKIMKLCNPS